MQSVPTPIYRSFWQCKVSPCPYVGGFLAVQSVHYQKDLGMHCQKDMCALCNFLGPTGFGLGACVVDLYLEVHKYSWTHTLWAYSRWSPLRFFPRVSLYHAQRAEMLNETAPFWSFLSRRATVRENWGTHASIVSPCRQSSMLCTCVCDETVC